MLDLLARYDRREGTTHAADLPRPRDGHRLRGGRHRSRTPPRPSSVRSSASGPPSAERARPPATSRSPGSRSTATAGSAEAVEPPEPELPPARPLEELMAELDDLVGLTGVKAEVKLVTDLIRVQNLRRERDLPVPDQSRHLVFAGNPGTGKTTVARLLAQIYRTLGVVEKGHLVETDRSQLVAGFVGQTAIRVPGDLRPGRGRRAAHRRGLRPRPGRWHRSRLRAGGGRHDREARRGPARLGRRDRGRLHRGDGGVRRLEPGPAVALPEDDHVPRLLDRRADGDLRRPRREGRLPLRRGRRRGRAALVRRRSHATGPSATAAPPATSSRRAWPARPAAWCRSTDPPTSSSPPSPPRTCPIRPIPTGAPDAPSHRQAARGRRGARHGRRGAPRAVPHRRRRRRSGGRRRPDARPSRSCASPSSRRSAGSSSPRASRWRSRTRATTADALVDGRPDFDAWVTIDPWPEMVDVGRQQAQQPDLFGRPAGRRLERPGAPAGRRDRGRVRVGLRRRRLRGAAGDRDPVERQRLRGAGGRRGLQLPHGHHRLLAPGHPGRVASGSTSSWTSSPPPMPSGRWRRRARPPTSPPAPPSSGRTRCSDTPGGERQNLHLGTPEVPARADVVVASLSRAATAPTA